MMQSGSREQLVTDVIETIVNAVNLQYVDRTGITPETPLTQGGLGLDSVDILEVVVAIEHRFGVKLQDAETGKKYFRTIGTVTDFVQTRAGTA
jgi:acyl carrier protein